VTLKPGLWITQGHRRWYHSIRHPLLPIRFHSNHRPISHRFRDKRRIPSKIANFSHSPCIFRPRERFPLELGIGAGVRTTRMMGYQLVENVLR